MFRRVALITFASILVRNQILLKNKQMIFRHLTFTFHFHFPEHPLRVFKKNHPSGVLPSRKLLLSSSTSPQRLHPPGLLLAGQCHRRWAGGLQPGDVEYDELPLLLHGDLVVDDHPPAPPHRTVKCAKQSERVEGNSSGCTDKQSIA